MLSSDWCRDGLMIPGTDNQWLVVRLLSVEGKFVKAHEFGQQVWSHFIFNHMKRDVINNQHIQTP